MRIWSLHPKYLDTKGLVALWRETLLARKVVEGNTNGYRNHPQLSRFKETGNPVLFLDCYLYEVWKEANTRGYSFNKDKLRKASCNEKISVTCGQIEYEMKHLKKKLEKRCPDCLKKIENKSSWESHPIFRVIDGGIESWEKTS